MQIGWTIFEAGFPLDSGSTQHLFHLRNTFISTVSISFVTFTMAVNTPPLSWKEQYDQQYNQLIQRRFNEVCNERDSAITINKKLKNANSGCWHLIANTQLEIDALHAKIATLHGTNRQLQQDLNTDRQTPRGIRDMIGTGPERATRQNTSPQTQHTNASNEKSITNSSSLMI